MAVTPGFFGIDEPVVIDKRADTNTMTRSATAVHREVVSIGSPNDTTPEQITEVTSGNGLHVNLRNNGGTEIGTASDPVRTDPTGTTTQPVSGTVAANAGTGDFLSIFGHTRNELFKESACVGVEFDDTTPVAATEGNVSPLRCSANRSLYVQLRDSTAERTADVTVANRLSVDVGASVLPTGAATSAGQLADGHNVTIQSNASVDVAQTLGSAISVTNPLFVRVGDGTSNIPFPTALVSGRFNVDVGGSVLPSGAATSGLQLAAGHDVTVDNAAGTNPVPVAGDTAHDGPNTGNPVRIAGFAEEDAPVEVGADGDTVNAWYSRKGQAVVVSEHPPQLVVAATHGPLTLTKSTTAIADLVGAPGASTSIYVTQLSASNTSGTFVRLDTSDGATIRDSMGLASDGGGFTKHFNPAWKLAANAALRVTLSAAVTDVRINVHYYTAPT